MSTHSKHGSLIQTLQKLYSRMVLFALHYGKGHGIHRVARHHDGDIASPLYDYIDRIAKRAHLRGKPDEHKFVKPSTVGPEATTSHQGDDVRAGVTSRSKNRALAGYFEGQKTATLLIPKIGNKLKNSTWEHLHEAIRFGRMGDIKNAKLHADLANSTLKEAVQYMSREEFEELLGEIEQKFDDVLAESKH